MFFTHVGTRAEDPLKSPELKQLKESLRQNPADEQIKTRIRLLDLQLRQTYFRQISRMKIGVYMLLGGVAVFLFSLRRTFAKHAFLPNLLQPKTDLAEQNSRAAAFAPVRDLGLVAWWGDGDDLLDEPRAPYPHVREVLLARAADEGAASAARANATSERNGVGVIPRLSPLAEDWQGQDRQ